MRFYRKNNKLIIEEDYWTKRLNPYMPDEDTGRHKTFIGLITKDEYGNEKMGLARIIDNLYKGKDDQLTEIQIHFWEDKENFEKMCREAQLDIVYL